MSQSRSAFGFFAPGPKAYETPLRVSGWTSEYPSVQRLLNYVARRTKSEATKAKYLDWLHRFCNQLGRPPDEAVKVAYGQLKHALQEFVNAAGRTSPDTGNNARAALLAFLRANGFDGDEQKEIQVEGFFSPTRGERNDEYIPTQEEIYRMANSGRYSNHRDRAIILSLYTSGLRNATLRALRWKDLKDEYVAGRVPLRVPVYPGMKEVVPDACKGKIPYYAFIHRDGVDALRLYLNEFEAAFGPISDGQVVFTGWAHNLPSEYRRRPLGRSSLVHIVKMAAKRAGVMQWQNVYPHCLRKAFETVLHSPLADGSRMDVKTQEFLMGHILPGSQDTYYDKSKVDLIRAEYAKLNFSPYQQTGRREAALEAVRRVAEAFGIDPLKVRIEKQRELAHELEPEEEIQALQSALKRFRIQPLGGGRPYKSTIVGEDALADYAEKGWEVVRELRSGRFLLRLPNSTEAS